MISGADVDFLGKLGADVRRLMKDFPEITLTEEQLCTGLVAGSSEALIVSTELLEYDVADPDLLLRISGEWNGQKIKGHIFMPRELHQDNLGYFKISRIPAYREGKIWAVSYLRTFRLHPHFTSASYYAGSIWNENDWFHPFLHVLGYGPVELSIDMDQVCSLADLKSSARSNILLDCIRAKLLYKREQRTQVLRLLKVVDPMKAEKLPSPDDESEIT